MFRSHPRVPPLFAVLLAACSAFAAAPAVAVTCPAVLELEPEVCPNVVTADVVALDQVITLNRAGATMPGGQIFALRSDVVSTSGTGELNPGEVALVSDKRPRPLVLRVNEGDCLRIEFQNLLAREPGVIQQTATVQAGVHVMGMSLVAACAQNEAGQLEPVEPIQADASFAGTNPNSLAEPGERRTYVLKAEQEGVYMLSSTGANFGLINGNGQIAAGLHGAVHVEPPGAVYLRSQVSRERLHQAARKCPENSHILCRTPHGQPLIDYDARDEEGKPILKMIDDEGHLLASDLTAIIAYQNPDGSVGDFPDNPENPLCFPVPAATQGEDLTARCTQPFREISAIYFEPLANISQAFPCLTADSATIDSELGSVSTGTTEDGSSTTTLQIPPAEGSTESEQYDLTVFENPCPDSYNVTPWLSDVFSAQSTLDAFGINYGVDGMSGRLLANRLRVGPQQDCVACKYEEFFLTSWPNGDPAQISTVPSGLQASDQTASQAAILYPDDPSNVYHSYLRDHVKYRIVHAGAAAAHVHHQHAHQWLHSPNADTAHYLDSQAITPGSTYTLEMVYDGSGNRNETVGDAIFHCHFYPHFASGMWSLWRVHDVFEEGTPIDPATGLPVSAWDCPPDSAGECRLTQPVRALPDGEIARGTPIPAVVPLPGRPMPPMPAAVALTPDGKRALTLVEERDGGWKRLGEEVPYNQAEAKKIGNPGYPFFIAGVAGQRPVRPPLDVVTLEVAGEDEPVALDGGLPRHMIDGVPTVAAAPDPPTGCTPEDAANTYRECHTRFDFSKTLLKVEAQQLAEDGEPVEQLAMAWHGDLFDGGRIPSCTPEGRCDGHFRVNGSPPVAGAPFADPCNAEDQWNGATRHYKAAAIQTDVVFNKDGWHYPQQRMLALWEDVEPTLAGERPPEPLFFRANSGECIDFWHANLVPNEYAMDDFQVRTPTDVIGQHIHLVKFDVTSSDGAANGFNYEDGTLSPDEVRERITAINAQGGLRVPPGERCPDGGRPDAAGRCRLEAKAIPFFGPGPRNTWLGAMASVQRWIADPLEDNYGDDRTLRSVFTHDHLSPSTHQQAGLYAGLLTEPACSQWVDSWTGEPMGGSRDPLDPASCAEAWAERPFDGGPTSWRSNIVYRRGEERELTGVREFALEYQDLALAYPSSSIFIPDSLSLHDACPSCPGPNLGAGIGPSDLGSKFNTTIGYPGPQNAIVHAPAGPWPQAVTFGAMYGGYNINYRNEPLPLRVTGADGSRPPASGSVPPNRDYAHVYRSIERELPQLNSQPDWYPPLTGGVEPYDPYTPLLETYAGDKVQVRFLIGAHFSMHSFTLRGQSWLFEPSLENSGYRAAQATGISEHFEANFTLPEDLGEESADYLYQTSAAAFHQSKGAWGLMRAYSDQRDFLAPLPDNPRSDGQNARPESPADRLQEERAAPERRTVAPGERGICDPSAPLRRYTVYALAAESFVPETTLPYYSPATITVQNPGSQGPKAEQLETAVESPEGLVYVHAEDVERTARGWALKPGLVFEPLVLRAAAGDCLEVTLVNHFDPAAAAFTTDNPTLKTRQNPVAAPAECHDAKYRELLEQVRSGTDPSALDGFAERCAGSYKASTHVGLHPQLVAFDPGHSSGYNVGRNPVQTAAPGEQITYYWYAGHADTSADGRRSWQPVEFGAANLLSADPLYQHPKGLFGALVIEPEGARWVTDANTRLTATVHQRDGDSFREGVLIFNDDLELYFKDQAGNYQALNNPNLNGATGQIAAVNYGLEFLAFRASPPALYDVTLNPDPGPTAYWAKPQIPDFLDQSCWLSSSQEGRDPATTLLTAHAGDPMRIRLLHPMGNFTPQTFVLHGHGWQEEPYRPLDDRPARDDRDGFFGPGKVPQTIGPNPTSQWLGSQGGFGPTTHFDVVLEPVQDGRGGWRHNGAGGSQRVPGDYHYRTLMSNGLAGGAWGLMRVGPEVAAGAERDIVAIIRAQLQDDGTVEIRGSNSSILGSEPGAERFARSVTIHRAENGQCAAEALATVDVPPQNGAQRSWRWSGEISSPQVCVRSATGGHAIADVLDGLPCGVLTENQTAAGAR